MKEIGLNISIGAKIGAAMGGLQKVASETTHLGSKMEALSNKRIDIIANDENVLRAKSKIEEVGKSIDELRNKKTEISLQIDKEREKEIKESIRGINTQLSTLREKKRVLKMQIKTTTDKKELEKLNKELSETEENMASLSKQKLKLREEFEEVQESNMKLNKELRETDGEIKKLNKQKIDLKDELKEAEDQAEKTNRAVNRIDRSIARINNSQIKIKQIVEKREIIKREFYDNVSRIGQTSLALGGVAYGMSQINQETTKMANLAETVGLSFGTVDALGGAIKGIGLNYENVTDIMEELNNKIGESKVKYKDWLKEDKGKGKELKLVGGVDDAFKGLNFSLSDKNFKGLNYEDTFKRFTKLSGDKQFELVVDTALKMKDEQKAASMVDILMGGEANKILSFLRKQDMTYKEFIDKKKKMNYLNEEGLKGAKEYAKVSAETSSIVGSMFKQIAGVGGSFMTPVLKDFNEYLIVNKEIIQADIKGFFEGVERTFKKVGKGIDWVTEKISPFLEMFQEDDDPTSWGFEEAGDDGREFGSTLAWIGTGIAALVGGKLILGTLATGLGIVSQAVRVLGIAATMNPVGLAIAGIATAGYLIYDNWESISGWWDGLWDGIGDVVSDKFGWVKTLFDWSPVGLLINNWQPIMGFMGGVADGAKNLFKMGWDGFLSILDWSPTEFVSTRWNNLMNFFSNFSLKDAGAKIITTVVDGFNSKIEYLKGKVASITETIREYWPFSPAKRGALRDIHRIKLMETIADGLNDKPLLNAVDSTTGKVRKAMALGGATMALGTQLAVAMPTVEQPDVLNQSFYTEEKLLSQTVPDLENRTFNTQELYAQAEIPNVLNRSFDTEENLLTKELPTLDSRTFETVETLKLANIGSVKDRTFRTQELYSQDEIPNVLNRSFDTEENLLTKELPTLDSRTFETVETLKLANIGSVKDRTFRTQELYSQDDMPMLLDKKLSRPNETEEKPTQHNTQKEATVNLSFGDIHIHNNQDEQEFLAKVVRTLQEELAAEKRANDNTRMYDQ